MSLSLIAEKDAVNKLTLQAASLDIGAGGISTLLQSRVDGVQDGLAATTVFGGSSPGGSMPSSVEHNWQCDRWSPSKAYVAEQITLYNGSVYRAGAPVAPGTLPSAGAPWIVMPAGPITPWAAPNAYIPSQKVSDGGVDYYALQPVPAGSPAPVAGPSWGLLAAQAGQPQLNSVGRADYALFQVSGTSVATLTLGQGALVITEADTAGTPGSVKLPAGGVLQASGTTGALPLGAPISVPGVSATSVVVASYRSNPVAPPVVPLIALAGVDQITITGDAGAEVDWFVAKF